MKTTKTNFKRTGLLFMAFVLLIATALSVIAVLALKDAKAETNRAVNIKAYAPFPDNVCEKEDLVGKGVISEAEQKQLDIFFEAAKKIKEQSEKITSKEELTAVDKHKLLDFRIQLEENFDKIRPIFDKIKQFEKSAFYDNLISEKVISEEELELLKDAYSQIREINKTVRPLLKNRELDDEQKLLLKESYEKKGELIESIKPIVDKIKEYKKNAMINDAIEQGKITEAEGDKLLSTDKKIERLRRKEGMLKKGISEIEKKIMAKD